MVSRATLVASALAALAAGAVLFPKLALPAAFLTLLGWITRPPRDERGAGLALGGLVVAALLSGGALLRFLVTEAMPGIAEGGERATSRSALERLREVRVAQDKVRELATVDPDGDGIGSALFLEELNGRRAPRGGGTLPIPLLNHRFGSLVETRLGTAAEGVGYLFVVCLPGAGGGYSARAGGPVDEERAERDYLAYAWPAATGLGVSVAYAVDAWERILESPNREGGSLRWAGPDHAPPCDAALRPGNDFAPWRNKQPRRRLPGDRAATPAP